MDRTLLGRLTWMVATLLALASPGIVHAQDQPSAAQPQAQSASPQTGGDQQQAPESDRPFIMLDEPAAEPRLPDSPGTVQATTPASAPEQQPAATPSIVETPSGTAAAQTGRIAGSPASRPAGVAIAPAKQRQVHSFLIKMGVIVGAGVALGTVAALTAGSSSKPPGAQ